MRLEELFRYDAKSGLLLWVVRRQGVKPGMPAGFMFNGTKYVQVDGKRVQVKNIVWLLVTGEWPEKRLRHMDGNRENCRYENLTMGKARKAAKYSEGVTVRPGPSGYTVEAGGRHVANTADIDRALAAVKALLLY